MATVGSAWRQAQKELEAAGLTPAPREGQLIMAHVLGREVSELGSLERQTLTPQNQWFIEDILKRRMNHEPLAYIFEYADFAGHTWAVAPSVLIPRPDTEVLVDAVIKVLKKPSALVVEVGVGSGAVIGSVLLARPEARGVGIEVSPAALSIAHDNLKEFKLLGRCKLVVGDLLEPFNDLADVIISNPPYIAEAEWAALEPDVRDFEPKLALVGGDDGLAVYRRLIPQTVEKLRASGVLAVEIGYKQGADVLEMFKQAGFVDTKIIPDFGGRARVVMGYKKAL